jgi:hypothetical protein
MIMLDLRLGLMPDKKKKWRKNYMNRKTDFNNLTILRGVITDRQLPIDVDYRCDDETGEFVGVWITTKTTESYYKTLNRANMRLANLIIEFDTPELVFPYINRRYNVELEGDDDNE